MNAPRAASHPGRSHSRSAVGAIPDTQLEQRIAVALHRVDAISATLFSPVFQECDTARAAPDQSCARAIYAAPVFALSTTLGRVGIASV